LQNLVGTSGEKQRRAMARLYKDGRQCTINFWRCLLLV